MGPFLARNRIVSSAPLTLNPLVLHRNGPVSIIVFVSITVTDTRKRGGSLYYRWGPAGNGGWDHTLNRKKGGRHTTHLIRLLQNCEPLRGALYIATILVWVMHKSQFSKSALQEGWEGKRSGELGGGVWFVVCGRTFMSLRVASLVLKKTTTLSTFSYVRNFIAPELAATKQRIYEAERRYREKAIATEGGKRCSGRGTIGRLIP